MTAQKAFNVIEDYQKALYQLSKQKGDILSRTHFMKWYQNRMLDICIKIIRPPFSFRQIKQSNIWVTRKWLYKNMTVNQMKAFIEKVMEPILPDESKKKIMEVEKIIGL